MAPKAAHTYYQQNQGLIEGTVTPEQAAQAIEDAVKAGA